MNQDKEIACPLNKDDKNDDKIDEIVTVDETDKLQNFPVDSGWAWMTVFASFGVCALIVGSLKSFGVLLVDLNRRLDSPTSSIVAAQSMAGCMHVLLAPMANALGNRFSQRIVVFIGGLFAGVGLISTSFVTSVEWLFVTYGIVGGIGFGITLGPSFVCMGWHFNKRRAFANGLAAAGSGAGSFALPNLIRYLLYKYGFQGCLLICGALVLNTSMFACLLRPKQFWIRSSVDRRKTNNAEEQEQEKMLKSDSKNESFNPLHSSTGNIETCKHNSITILNSSKFSSHPNLNLDSVVKYENIHSKKMNTNSANDDRLNNFHLQMYTSLESLSAIPFTDKQTTDTKGKSSIGLLNFCRENLDWSILKNPSFLVIAAAIWCGILGNHNIFNCLPPLCEEFGMSDTEGAFVVSIIGISDLFGRIVCGWLADFKTLKRRYVFQTSLGLFGIFLFITPHIKTFYGMCVISAFSGFSTGGHIGTQVSVLADAFGIEKLASSVGFTFFFASVALFLSPSLSGIIKDVSGTWANGVRMSAGAALFGSLILFTLPLIEKCNKTNNEQNVKS